MLILELLQVGWEAENYKFPIEQSKKNNNKKTNSFPIPRQLSWLSPSLQTAYDHHHPASSFPHTAFVSPLVCRS